MLIEFHNKSEKEAYKLWREVNQTVRSSNGNSRGKQHTQEDPNGEQSGPWDNTCPSERSTTGNS